MGVAVFVPFHCFFFSKWKERRKKSALKWKLCNYHFKIGWIWENCSSLLNSFILIALDSVDLLAITVQCTKRTWYNVYAYRGHKWSFRHINLLLTDYTQPWWNDVEKCMNIGQHGCIGWINVVKKRSNSIYTCFCQEELCPFAIPNRINNWTLQTIGFKYISMKDMHSVTNGIDKWNSDVALQIVYFLGKFRNMVPLRLYRMSPVHWASKQHQEDKNIKLHNSLKRWNFEV